MILCSWAHVHAGWQPSHTTFSDCCLRTLILSTVLGLTRSILYLDCLSDSWVRVTSHQPPTLLTAISGLSCNEVEVKFRLTVSRPVCLGVGLPPGTQDKTFLFCLTTMGFLMLGICSDKRMGFNLLVQLLLGPSRAVTLGFKSHRTHNHILLSHLRLSPTWRARSLYFYPPGTGWGPNRVDVHLCSPEDRSRQSFQNVKFSSYLDGQWTNSINQ
jgi:hypothetical protein